MSAISLQDFGAGMAALSALATAAFGLLDTTKAFWGGISNVGLGHIRTSLEPFEPALNAAVGADNKWKVIRANWLNGVPKAEQKAVVRALIKLGLSVDTAPSLAAATHVSAAALTAAARKLADGKPMTEADMNVLGRMNAVIDALLDAAFEAAEQQYRNYSRAIAGLIAVLLSLVALLFWPEGSKPPTVFIALAVGLLAVPLAPVAKDLTSALSTAMRALKAAKAV